MSVSSYLHDGEKGVIDAQSAVNERIVCDCSYNSMNEACQNIDATIISSWLNGGHCCSGIYRKVLNFDFVTQLTVQQRDRQSVCSARPI